MASRCKVVRLLFEADRVVLEKVYTKSGVATNALPSRTDLQALTVDYMVYCLLGDDTEGAKFLLGNRKLLDEHIPHWQAISTMMQALSGASSTPSRGHRAVALPTPPSRAAIPSRMLWQSLATETNFAFSGGRKCILVSGFVG